MTHARGRQGRQGMLKGSFRGTLSPPLWKDQLKQRCMERLKQNRSELLAKLRSPDANIAAEMKRFIRDTEVNEGAHAQRGSADRAASNGVRKARHPVFDLQNDVHDMGGACEQQIDSGSAEVVTVEDLMAMGKLSDDDYLEIAHSLEEALMQESNEDEEDEMLYAQQMEYEEASLAAMLEGMDLDAPAVPHFRAMSVPIPSAEYAFAAHVLCPICKTGTLREDREDGQPVIFCPCGFFFQPKEPSSNVLEDFEDLICAAMMDHAEQCSAEPHFVKSAQCVNGRMRDIVQLVCGACQFHGNIQ